jgi:hypothetical protein
VPTQPDTGPHVCIEQVACRAETDPDRWCMTWRLQNASQQPVQLVAARLPHGRFRSGERTFVPPPTLLPSESAPLEFSVVCSGAPGTVVENAFVILRVLWQEAPWRIFARLRVVFDEQRRPQTTTELVTVQQVGFSEPLNSV